MLKIELPWPDPSLSPNRKNGKHWGSTQHAKNKRRTSARLLALYEMRKTGYVPPPGKLALRLTFCPPDKRRRDLDNLLASMKADFDGISQALGVDDQHFEPIILQRGAVAKPGLVSMEIGSKGFLGGEF